MADKFSKEKRSEIMSKINSKSGLEEKFCKRLSKLTHPAGYRYRRNYRKLKGTPDVVFVRHKIAVFVDGSFWHGYKYSAKTTRLSEGFWKEKIENNIRRDKRNRRILRKEGWKVIRIWEHEFKKNPDRCVGKVFEIVSSTIFD